MKMRYAKTLRSVLIACVTVIVVCAVTPAAGAVVQKGIIDLRSGNAAAREAHMAELSSQLHAKWTRVTIRWSVAEPKRGKYNESYLAGIKQSVDLAYTYGIKVICTIVYTPSWAADRRFLKSPPWGYKPGVAYKFSALDPKYLPDFGEFTTKVVHLLGTHVAAIECWNEPNLWLHIYPQQTAQDVNFAAHLYTKMLHELWIHVKTAREAGQTDALVVAGATAPIGQNGPLSTSPQRFARVLRDGGAAKWFDVYSHHPYGTYAPPGAPPRTPSHSVTLGNLSVLLKLFPNKPFYLTEYGYTTKYVAAFGGFPVSQVLQASYLTRSYSYLSRYPQVKVLLWFLVQDLPPNSGKEAYYGVYMGLRTTLGVPKLSWFAFAGGNHLSVTMPSTVKLGDTMPISGELTTSFLPATPRQTLIVERKLPGQDWVKVKLFHTFAGGAFATTVRPRVSGAIWRVRWNPIAVSSSQMVTVNQ